MVPVAGCGLNALSGLQNHTNQYVELIAGRIKRASVASGIWLLSPDAA
ncbi:hypothetical protein ECEC1846_3163 [Escherichia coli EC1846]|nr:hypothetical protein ECPA31_3109 [Escherichia coli PA31]EIP09915.1 hypothetical protein ECTW14301_3089 [Escherichia coli TW14301]EIP23865.1 hypothetical protein ECEC4422_3237 [Escherichia coli EC4422]EKH24568.1 hypothetical protein ECFDA504_3254 [Escherichia coli FDA504]EKI69669.1 hypothetical protein ECEC1846_3163 [Escherichia coli EC1846]EKJ35580.1 hypothetical protein ECEC1869_3331 [Escherichia coli EC1869]EKK28095.1 hypothetical protein EC34870_3281 [Escherichia coli 3.4870]EKW13617.1